ncbi:rhomboid family intramembrane serine protease [Pedobacter polaris]|uniref:Rhomboid family intramembrane serine protease n=1 Tax=Pedobacter polaris TaxID=2571273 RepID=A0A4U1CXH7_9SPHI|nr:rhomboid family intramembrane serine protease [Pedobacter polaris]TKC12129.1 rhomboid family intramembrane serine protease [Pedobacter polaris]
MNNITPVVKNLLIINVIFYFATWLLGQQGIPLTKYLAVYYFDSPAFSIWQPITYMFMHSSQDIMHIIFNMFALYSFGSILEAHWGGKRFINFYLITGLGALALQWGVQAFEVYQMTGSAINDLSNISTTLSPEQIETMGGIYFGPMVGASGAIFGLLVAFAMLYPNLELYIMFIPVPVKAKYIIPVYIVLEFFLGVAKFQGDSVAHFAHLGGALIGYILVKIWRNKNTYFDYYD